MGASDTSWVMQRKRMSQTASILVTGRDMDNKTLRLHEENCVWILDEEESTEQIVAKAVPSYLWKVADYIDGVGTWQGTATELLSAADIEGVLPHQLTRKIVEHFDTVFTPREIRYETHRTSQARQMKFSHDGNDADCFNADAFLSGIVQMTGDLVKAYPFLSDAEAQRFGTGKEEIGK